METKSATPPLSVSEWTNVLVTVLSKEDNVKLLQLIKERDSMLEFIKRESKGVDSSLGALLEHRIEICDCWNCEKQKAWATYEAGIKQLVNHKSGEACSCWGCINAVWSSFRLGNKKSVAPTVWAAFTMRLAALENGTEFVHYELVSTFLTEAEANTSVADTSKLAHERHLHSHFKTLALSTFKTKIAADMSLNELLVFERSELIKIKIEQIAEDVTKKQMADFARRKKQSFVLEDVQEIQELKERKSLFAVVDHPMFASTYMVAGLAATRRGARQLKDKLCEGKGFMCSINFSIVEVPLGQLATPDQNFTDDMEVPNYDDHCARAMVLAAVEELRPTLGTIELVPSKSKVDERLRMCGIGCSLYFEQKSTGNTITVWWAFGMVGGGRSVENGRGPFYYTTYSDLKDAIRSSILRENQEARDYESEDVKVTEPASAFVSKSARRKFKKRQQARERNM